MDNKINTGTITVEEINEIQNFINFLNKVFDNDENFIDYDNELPPFAKYEIYKLVENELNRIKDNFIDEKLPAEFYSALENAGYDFYEGTELDFDYYSFDKNHKRLVIYY